MSPPLVILLDTNHISDMARTPTGVRAGEVVRRLQTGQAHLAISLLQIVELANPAFRDVDEVKALLRDIPTLLANPFENVEEDEMACAVARAVGFSRPAPRVFVRDTSEWGDLVGPVGGSALDMLDAFAHLEEQRTDILAMARYGAESSMLKRQAALAKEPLLPLTLAMEYHLRQRRAVLPTYGGGLTPADVIHRVGGRSAFPGYEVQESLVAERMMDPGQKSTANDVLDEFIAFHSPYAAATALDRRTIHRAKMAKLPHLERMTRDLDEIPRILDAVQSGAHVPAASAW